jgi:hypothetical protein
MEISEGTGQTAEGRETVQRGRPGGSVCGVGGLGGSLVQTGCIEASVSVVEPPTVSAKPRGPAHQSPRPARHHAQIAVHGHGLDKFPQSLNALGVPD